MVTVLAEEDHPGWAGDLQEESKFELDIALLVDEAFGWVREGLCLTEGSHRFTIQEGETAGVHDKHFLQFAAFGEDNFEGRMSILHTIDVAVGITSSVDQVGVPVLGDLLFDAVEERSIDMSTRVEKGFIALFHAMNQMEETFRDAIF